MLLSRANSEHDRGSVVSTGEQAVARGVEHFVMVVESETHPGTGGRPRIIIYNVAEHRSSLAYITQPVARR